MQSTATATVEIATEDENFLRGDLYLPREPAGICVLCHGFKGYRTWGFFPYLAAGLIEKGVAALVIDFSHNGTIPSKGGESPGDRDATGPYINPDLFRKNTINRERSDLSYAIRFVLESHLGGTLAGHLPLGLFGHSRGGVSVILNALEFKEVRVICTWSTPVHPDVFSSEQKRRWREEGAAEFTDSATNTPMTVDRTYLEDIEENYDLYNMEKSVGQLEIPHLIVHGTLDLAIPPESAIKLYRAENHLTERRIVLVKSGHTFGITNTSHSQGEALKKVQEETVSWFKRHLYSGEG